MASIVTELSELGASLSLKLQRHWSKWSTVLIKLLNPFSRLLN
jgi:hypothetical protein